MMTEKSSSALPISTIGRRLVRTMTPGVRSHTACVHVLWSTGGVCGGRKMGDTITSTHLTSNSGFAREPRRDTRLLTCATKDNAEVSVSVLLMRMRRSCAARTASLSTISCTRRRVLCVSVPTTLAHSHVRQTEFCVTIQLCKQADKHAGTRTHVRSALSCHSQWQWHP